MLLALIIAGSALAAALGIAFAIWAHQYTKVGPNEGAENEPAGPHRRPAENLR